ncbi:flocculation protein FLO11-like [Poecilia formosa]|uniref:flocculation protein FLO11-like n=1 Tax=Poecilia formosa TaxID=48698 RepID=UPI0004445CE2|nr:PREDICTED: flocculation protein FLO11-like [Poecilia formosa]
MRFEIHLVCFWLLLVTGSPQTGGQTHALPTSFTSTPFPAPAEAPVNEFPPQTQYPAGRNETSGDLPAPGATAAPMESIVRSETSADAGHLHVSSSTKATSQFTNVPTVTTPSLSDGLSSAPTTASSTRQQATSRRYSPTGEAHSTFSSGATTPSSTAHTPAPGWVPVGPTHREFPSELNIGDDDSKGSHRYSSSPLDPLLAGLLSVFIITTAVVFTVLFFKFRQRANHPEFHRLQDLPMDDLMEDTPLSRYAH